MLSWSQKNQASLAAVSNIAGTIDDAQNSETDAMTAKKREHSACASITQQKDANRIPSAGEKMRIIGKRRDTRRVIRVHLPRKLQWKLEEVRQEGFLRCQTPTSTVKLKAEGCRVKNGECRIKSEQAGAELCQAQIKLGLAMLASPWKKLRAYLL